MKLYADSQIADGFILQRSGWYTDLTIKRFKSM